MSTLQNTPLRLIELRAQVTYQEDERGEWQEIARDPPVSAQFNTWADENDMNPAWTPTITVQQERGQHGDGRNWLVRTYILCAVVISREEQWRMEMAYRTQTARLCETLTSSRTETPITSPPPSRPGPSQLAPPTPSTVPRVPVVQVAPGGPRLNAPSAMH